jgi:hypothetical protein
MNNKFSAEKYNAFKDGSFWAALVIGLILSAQSIYVSLSTMTFNPSLLPGLFLTIAWVGCVIYMKGSTGSLVVGFLIALVFAGIGIIIAVQIESARMDAHLEKSMENYRKNIDLKIQNQ